MNILIVSDHYLPRIGGAEYATHNLADALTRRGHRVTVLAPAIADKSQEVRADYRIARRFYPRFVPSSLTKTVGIATEYLRQRFDVMHAQLLFPAGYEATWFRRMFNVPLVVSPQGADIHTYPPLNYGLLLDPGNAERIRRTIRYADGLTYSSALMRRTLLDLGYEGKHCYYLPNGTTLARFDHGRREQIRRTLNLAPETTTFITISRHSAIKGLPLLLQALAGLKGIGADWRSIIAGSNVHELRSLVESHGLSDRVILISDLPIERDADGIPVSPSREIADLLVAADVYVSPALSGGFELSNADSMAAGLPTIIADENGGKDVVERYAAGIVVPTGSARGFESAVRTLLDDPVMRSHMRENALKAGAKLDWNIIASDAEMIYERVIADRRNS